MADIYVALATSEAGVDRHVVLKRVLDARARDEDFASMFLVHGEDLRRVYRHRTS